MIEVKFDSSVIHEMLRGYAMDLTPNDFVDADEDGYYSVTPDCPEIDLDELMEQLVSEQDLDAMDCSDVTALQDALKGIVETTWDENLDEWREELADAAAYARDPYSYYGVRRSDFF